MGAPGPIWSRSCCDRGLWALGYPVSVCRISDGMLRRRVSTTCSRQALPRELRANGIPVIDSACGLSTVRARGYTPRLRPMISFMISVVPP
ncbi:hypothetical protein [Mycobacterium cookii]|nr:hypothetical protein [Mycobacterium cookii]MCV7330157.1 hypothetical protein [Mycobacterium cookii]